MDGIYLESIFGKLHFIGNLLKKADAMGPSIIKMVMIVVLILISG